MPKRNIKVAVISDTHLGTYGCHAKELNTYLKSIDPEILIINGDFIDIWNLSKYYFPKSHVKVLQTILKMMGKGTQIYYITGNHDEMLRKYSGMCLGNFTLDDKLVLELDGKKHWFFHGDVFDVTMKHSKWIAKLGGSGYDFLILINRLTNLFLQKIGREKISLSKKVKDSVKLAVKHISNFEQTAADIAISDGYDYVVMGHIHEPVMKTYINAKGMVQYLNSGDWIENLTSLEYNNGEWSLKYYNEMNLNDEDAITPEAEENVSHEFEQFQSVFVSKLISASGQ